MPTAYIGFMLKPTGFFDMNPANDVPPERGEGEVSDSVLSLRSLRAALGTGLFWHSEAVMRMMVADNQELLGRLGGMNSV